MKDISVKKGDLITIWYIKDGRQKFCSGAVKEDNDYFGYIELSTYDRYDVRISKNVIFEIDLKYCC